MAGNLLKIDRVTEGDTVTLRCIGELDVVHADQLMLAAEDALGSGGRSLWVDASGVGFVDSSGLRAIVQACERCSEAGGSATVVVASGSPLLRLLKLSGMENRLPVMVVQPEPEPSDDSAGNVGFFGT
jgi:anti-sigma B factor antagonist